MRQQNFWELVVRGRTIHFVNLHKNTWDLLDLISSVGDWDSLNWTGVYDMMEIKQISCVPCTGRPWRGPHCSVEKYSDYLTHKHNIRLTVLVQEVVWFGENKWHMMTVDKQSSSWERTDIIQILFRPTTHMKHLFFSWQLICPQKYSKEQLFQTRVLIMCIPHIYKCKRARAVCFLGNKPINFVFIMQYFIKRITKEKVQ